MKKILIVLLVFCTLFSYTSAFAVAENIIIDGNRVTIPAEMGRVHEKDDRNFVPVRFVSEYLGCIVNYEPTQQSVTITDPKTGTSYFIMAGDNKIYVLPKVGSAPIVLMDTVSFIDRKEDRMYIPVRFFAEAIGYTVGWDGATQTVTLTASK